MWSAISEIKGRKLCYITAIGEYFGERDVVAPSSLGLGSQTLTTLSTVIYIVATTVASRATNIGTFVAMRVLQALGSGAVVSRARRT